MTNNSENSAPITILGMQYQIKCQENEVASLQRAAEYLEEKIKMMRETGKVLNTERIAILTALNIAYQFLSLETQSNQRDQLMKQRLLEIQSKVENSLLQQKQMELHAAD